MALYLVFHPEDQNELFSTGKIGMLNTINQSLVDARTPLEAARKKVWGNNPTLAKINEYMDQCVIIEVTSTACLVDFTDTEEYKTLKAQEDEIEYAKQKEKDLAELKRIQEKYKDLL